MRMYFFAPSNMGMYFLLLAIYLTIYILFLLKGSPVWWNSSLKKQKKHVYALRRKFQKCHDQNERSIYLLEYKKELAFFKKNIRCAKKNSCKIIGKKLTITYIFFRPGGYTTNNGPNITLVTNCLVTIVIYIICNVMCINACIVNILYCVSV